MGFFLLVWEEVGDGDGFSMEIVKEVEMLCGNGIRDLRYGRFVGRGSGKGSVWGYRIVFVEPMILALRFCDWGDILTYCSATVDEKHH